MTNPDNVGGLPPQPPIDRFAYTGGSYPMSEDPNGEYVDYDDHVAAMHAYAELCRAAPAVGEPNGRLVGWWNGITPGFDGMGMPSIRWGADAEDSRHDIPLYDGYNPIHYVTPVSAPAGGDVPPEDHRNEAGIDAELLGTGFLVDGKRVAPERVEMIIRLDAPAGGDAVAWMKVGGDLFDDSLHEDEGSAKDAVMRDPGSRVRPLVYGDSAPAGSGEAGPILIHAQQLHLDGHMDQCALDELTALLRKLQQGADYVMVPNRPTEAMEKAAAHWQRTYYDCDPLGDRGRFYRGIYDAMIAASQGQEGGK